MPENAEFYVVTDRKVITYDPDREVNQIVSVKLSDVKKVTIEKSIKGKSTLKLHKDYIKLYFIEDAAEVRELILSSRVSETR